MLVCCYKNLLKLDKIIEKSHSVEHTVDDAADNDTADSEEETTVTLEATDNLYWKY